MRAIAFEVKEVKSDNPDGEFEAVISAPTLDRDGEVIDPKAFEPLPESIPIHKFHYFDAPVAVAKPYYDGDVLKARGTFDPDPDAQQFRSKVGRSVGFMSVGFMAASRTDVDGTPHVTKAELLEASFVSVPANREAAILAVKAFEGKVGSRNSTKDAERLQSVHDLAVENGAACGSTDETRGVNVHAHNGSTSTQITPKTANPEEAAAAAAADPPAEVDEETQLLALRARALSFTVS